MSCVNRRALVAPLVSIKSNTCGADRRRDPAPKHTRAVAVPLRVSIAGIECRMPTRRRGLPRPKNCPNELWHDWEGGLRFVRGAILAHERAVGSLHDLDETGAPTAQSHRAGTGGARWPWLVHGGTLGQLQPNASCFP
jgi:hypothetical protein